jgi:hypothetical protein
MSSHLLFLRICRSNHSVSHSANRDFPSPIEWSIETIQQEREVERDLVLCAGHGQQSLLSARHSTSISRHIRGNIEREFKTKTKANADAKFNGNSTSKAKSDKNGKLKSNARLKADSNAKPKANEAGARNRSKTVKAAMRSRPFLPGRRESSLPMVENSCPVNKMSAIQDRKEKLLRDTLGCGGRGNPIHGIGSILESEKYADHQEFNST